MSAENKRLRLWGSAGALVVYPCNFFLAFCKLQEGIFQRSVLFIDGIAWFYMLKSCCESSLSEDIGQCYFLLLQVYCLSSSLEEVFLARHAIFCFDHNSRT